MTFRKYLVLAGVTLFAAIGDTFLSRGMKQVGNISLHSLPDIFLTILNPWVALGIFFLLGFFASYMTALSWADLTYVLPATSLGYVLLALIAKFFLHEQVTTMRWLGIALISAGVGFVTQGPGLDTPSIPSRPAGIRLRSRGDEDSVMKHAYTWGAIMAVVLASTTGDVLLSRAMKKVGDVGQVWRSSGLMAVVGRILRRPSFVLGIVMMAVAFFSLLFALSWADVSLVAPASASLTFIANAIAAKIFLHERVDHRRWIAALLVAGGVVLLASLENSSLSKPLPSPLPKSHYDGDLSVTSLAWTIESDSRSIKH